MLEFIIGVIVLGVAAYFVIQKMNSKSEPVSEPEAPKTKKEVERHNHEATIQRLLTVNLNARIKGMEEEILTSLESAIDSVRHISEDMAKLENFSELSVLFGRITDRYLPEIVNGYLKLSEDKRAEKREETLKAIQMIEEKAKDIEDSIGDESTRDFEKTSLLINSMLKTLGGE